MITAMSPSTTGNRDVMASTLSRLTCAVPANSTSRPPGPWTACRPSSWASEDSENSGAVLRTVRYALPPATWTGDTPATSGNPSQIRCVPVDLGFGQTTGVGHHDGHRGGGVVGELGAHLITDLVGRRGRRQYPIVGESPLHPEERGPEQQEQQRRPPTRRGGRAA